MYRPELYFDPSIPPPLAAITLSFGLPASLVMLTWEAPVSVRSTSLIFDIRVTKSIPGISQPLTPVANHENPFKPLEAGRGECTPDA